jgi:CubicO group peptidase (beta-lactamase class C family)
MKRIKILFKLIIFITISFSFSSCYIWHVIKWRSADMNDYKKFSSVKITKPNESFKFHEARQIEINKIRLPEELKSFKDLNDLISKTQTLSFLIIRNDSIVYEKYYYDTDENTVFPSFSVAKSFVSALIGIAIDEGYIKSVDQPITDFLPELKDKNFHRITIEHLLNMKTGLKFSENYSSPFSDVVKYYYGPNLKRYIKHLKIANEPGKTYDYVSVSSQLLSLIIERATHKNIVDYLQEKIWNPLGMEFDASWSVDSKRHKTVKAFCCINSHSRDFAKFGRLYLNKGNWNGKQVITKDWVTKSLAYSKDSIQNFYYHYQWRVGNKGDFFAKGAMGQFIYINSAKKTIIVRTGNEYGIEAWQEVFRKICDTF